jgi:hypothetical protein
MPLMVRTHKNLPESKITLFKMFLNICYFLQVPHSIVRPYTAAPSFAFKTILVHANALSWRKKELPSTNNIQLINVRFARIIACFSFLVRYIVYRHHDNLPLIGDRLYFQVVVVSNELTMVTRLISAALSAGNHHLDF